MPINKGRRLFKFRINRNTKKYFIRHWKFLWRWQILWIFLPFGPKLSFVFTYLTKKCCLIFFDEKKKKFAQNFKKNWCHVTSYDVIYHSTKNKTIIWIKMTNTLKLSVKNYSEKWSNFCHLDLWFRRYKFLYFWWRHQFDVTMANLWTRGSGIQICIFQFIIFSISLWKEDNKT